MDNKIILLVEDNENDELLALRALRKNDTQNEVIVVRDGAEALDYLFGAHAGRDTAKTPSVVLLDLKLPKVEGFEVLRQIRRDRRTHFLPVIIFTSSKEEEDVIKGYRNGANSYVQKPVDSVQFAEVLRQLSRYWLTINEVSP